MALTIGELVGIITLQDRFSGPAGKVASGIGGMSKSFEAVTKFAGLSAAAIGATATAIVALGVHGSKVQAMKTSFNSLSDAIGQSGDEMLEASRGATKGLISDFDLMAAANKAMLLGLPATSESMATMAKAATVLGRAMNQDATKSLDDLTTALGRGSPLILDNLGLTVKVSEANEAYARSLGKSANDLTEAEKKMAFYNAAMEAARQKVGELGDVQLTFGDRVQQARVFLTNFIDSLSAAVATSPVIAAGWDAMAEALQGAFGGRQQETVQALMGFINRFAIFLADVANVAVEAGRFITNAFTGTKVIFQIFLEGVAEGLDFLVGGLADLAQKATEIPVVGERMQGLAEGMRKVADFTGSLKVNFAALTEETIQGAADQNAAFDKVKGVVATARDAMVSAQGAQALTNQTVRDFGAAAEEAEKRSSEASTKIEEKFKRLQEELALAQTEGIERRLLELEFARERELEGLRSLTDITTEQYSRAAEIVKTTYEVHARAATDASAEILATTQRLQQELALATTIGLQQRLLEIEFARQKEIAGIEHLRERSAEEYGKIGALIEKVYAKQVADATHAHTSIEAAANAQGFRTREQMQQTADLARETFDRMKESGKFTYDELQKAHEAYKTAEAELNDEVFLATREKFELLADSVSTILTTLFGKNKAAAIAAALIDTYAAVAKALSAYPWPFNLAPAAAALAVGLAQVNKIRSTEPAGFRTGTPGTSFVDFGAGAREVLHGEEAVLTRAQSATVGSMVASMVEDAIRSANGAGGGRRETLHLTLNLDGRHLREWMMEQNETGRLVFST